MYLNIMPFKRFSVFLCVCVCVQKLFSTLNVLGVSELNLSANQWKDEMKRFDWSPEKGTGHSNRCQIHWGLVRDISSLQYER